VAALASWVSFDAIVWLAHDPPGLGKHVGAHLDVWPAVALDRRPKRFEIGRVRWQGSGEVRATNWRDGDKAWNRVAGIEGVT
jgi:hypothetical protein